jgi:hypothetical protein
LEKIFGLFYKVNPDYFRESIVFDNKNGKLWILIDGLLKHISIGEYGIWEVNSNNEI